jgi:hypothetical protein
VGLGGGRKNFEKRSVKGLDKNIKRCIVQSSATGDREMFSQEERMRKALESIVMGLTHPDNKCWPTVRPWTKKERDEAMLNLAREALKED